MQELGAGEVLLNMTINNSIIQHNKMMYKTKELEEIAACVADFLEAAEGFMASMKAYERECERAKNRIKEIGDNYMRADGLLCGLRKEAAYENYLSN